MSSLADVNALFADVKREIRKDYRPILEEVDRYLNQRIDQSFALRQTPDGQAWPIGWDGNPATLEKTKAMHQSLTSGGPGGIRDITSDHLEKGTVVEQAGYQFYGVPKRRTPKRKQKHGPPKPGSAAARRMAAGKRNRRRPKKRRVMGPINWRIPPRPFIGLTEQDADAICKIAAQRIAR